MLNRIVRQWLAISCISLLTTACGGGGGGSGGSSASNTASTPASSSSPAVTSAPAPTANSTSSTPAATSTPSTGSSYSIHITWVAPTTRADGSALPISALTGYRLFYTRDGSSSSEDTVVSINGGTTTSTQLSLPSAGTYAFSITAIDSNNVESALSTPVSITIN